MLSGHAVQVAAAARLKKLAWQSWHAVLSCLGAWPALHVLHVVEAPPSLAGVATWLSAHFVHVLAAPLVPKV